MVLPPWLVSIMFDVETSFSVTSLKIRHCYDIVKAKHQVNVAIYDIRLLML